MTALEALAILEAAVLECKKRNVNTPEVKAALDLLAPHTQPKWLSMQFQHYALKIAPMPVRLGKRPFGNSIRMLST
jgi:hypothetical protein